MTTKHTVHSFELALSGVRQDVLDMGQVTSQQLSAAVALLDEAFNDSHGQERAVAEAGSIQAADADVDQFDQKIEQEVQRILALRQPMAADLRSLLSCDRIASDLERIADHAKNIAKRAGRIRDQGHQVEFAGTRALATEVIAQLDAVLAAIEAHDAEAARVIWAYDNDIDRLFEDTFNRQLQGICQSPDTAVSCTNALFIAKALERVGDHVTNIAEDLIYWVTGERLARRITADDA